MVGADPDPTGRTLATARRYVGLARHVPTTVVSVCVALVLCSGVVTALVLPAASDSTAVLRHPRSVTVTPAGGTAAKGHDGQVLDPGDVVNVAQGGAGEITTGPRRLWLGGTTQVRVDGPASTEIRRGSVVAEDSGKPWSLQADQVTVSGLTGAVRIDYGYSTRVADYDGLAQLSVPTGATQKLTGLDQVDAAGPILGSLAPLKLFDDGLDTIAAPALVTLDAGLAALAGQIDADPVVLATYRSSSENPSERLLPVAIASAGTGSTDALRARAAIAARAAQGSWGVIAAVAGASLTGVRSNLSTLLDSSPKQAAALAAAVAQTASVASATPGAPVSTPVAPTVVPSTGATPSPSSGSPAARPTVSATTVSLQPVPTVSTSVPGTTAVTAKPSGTPVTVPSPSPTPLINVLLNAVGGLLPSPNPVPTGLPGGLGGTGGMGGAKSSPTPSASPTPLLNGVLNTVGGL